MLNYQHTVQTLLNTWNFPSISIRQLEKFKQDFRSAVFTCRFNCCPLGQTGFDSEALRDEHERTHTPTVLCEVPGCTYPPFPSTRALKNHCAKYHDQGMPRIRIKPTGEPQKRRYRMEDMVHAKKLDSIEPGVTLASEMRIRPGTLIDLSIKEPISGQATALSDETYLDTTQAMQAMQAMRVAAPQVVQRAALAQPANQKAFLDQYPAQKAKEASLLAQQTQSRRRTPELGTPYRFFDRAVGALHPMFIRAKNFETPGTIRLKVYELRGNDWFDRGTGLCTCGYPGLVCQIYLKHISSPNLQLRVIVPRFSNTQSLIKTC